MHLHKYVMITVAGYKSDGVNPYLPSIHRVGIWDGLLFNLMPSHGALAARRPSHECGVTLGGGKQKYRRHDLNNPELLPFTMGKVSGSDDTSELNLLQLDQFSWTALISQYTRCGQHSHALEAYEHMRKSGVKLSSYTIVAVLKACSNLQDLDGCRKIHAEVLKTGLESNVFVATMLVDVYSKCGSLADARCVFERTHHRNVVSWNSMIWAYARSGQETEALYLYTRMQQEGVAPDHRTLVGALKACSSLVAREHGVEADGLNRKACLEQVTAIHLHAMKSGCESNLYVATMLVDVYAKCGQLEDARNLFEKMPRRSVVSWTAMILGYVQLNQGRLALQLYEKMQHEGVQPNERTFVGALKACSCLARLKERDEDDGQHPKKEQWLEQVRHIHAQVLKAGSESDIYVGNALVDVYAKCGSVEDARLVFDSMPHHDVVSWNTLISAYAQIDKGAEALLLYSEMQRDGTAMDDRTFLGALRACCSLAGEAGNNSDGKCMIQSLEQVRAIHADLVRRGSKADGRLGNILVDAYAKCGSLLDATDVFEKMSQRDVVSWTAIISGYAQMEMGQLALQLFARMQQEGVVPNDRTFVGAIKACASVAALEVGKRMHAQLVEAGIDDTNLFVASCLVDLYGKCGSMTDAEQVFQALPRRNSVTWSALIAGYAAQGDVERALDSFTSMVEEGIRPDAISFLNILSACSHVGQVKLGEEYFESMSRDYGIEPTTEHYNCMVDLLGRQGLLERAITLVKSMPLQPPLKIWRSVLAACQKWKNVEIGRDAFEHAVRLDKNDAATYALMSNIYKAANMWEAAGDVQGIKQTSGAWKDPGQLVDGQQWNEACIPD